MERNRTVISKKYREYLVPTILTSMATQIASFVDSVMASNLVCSKSIAAISLIMPILQFLYSVTILFGLGASSLISRAQGENDKKTANHFFTISFIVVSIISIIALIVQLIFKDSIIPLFSNDLELRQLASEYYKPFVIGIPIYMLLFSAIHIVRLDGRPKFASMIMIVANLVNLGADYLFMGVFKWGIAGSSWATLLGNSVGMAMVLSHFIQGKSSLKLSIGKTVFWKLLKRLFNTGIAGAMGALFNVLRLQFFVSVISAISGAIGLVAFSLCTTATRLISMFIAGASQAMIPIVSLCYGEKDYQGVRYVLNSAIKVLLIAGGALMLYFLILPDTFISLFGITNPQEQALSHTALVINAIAIPGEALLFLFLYYFMAIDVKIISRTLSIMYGLGVLGFGFVLSKIMGINGIWWAMVFTDYVALLVALIMAWRKKKEDLYLVPKNDPDDIVSLSTTASVENAIAAGEFTQRFFEKTNQAQDCAVRVALAVEEITLQIKEANKSKKTDIDIRICKHEDSYYLSIRDNGIPNNTIDSTKTDEILSGLQVLRGISYKMEYSLDLGFNRTLIIIKLCNIFN